MNISYDIRNDVTSEDLYNFLLLDKKEEIQELYKRAREVRNHYCGGYIYIRGLLEISNVCSRNCVYCGLRHANKSIKRYTMRSDEILHSVLQIAECGIKTVVLQSGESFAVYPEVIRDVIIALKEYGDIAVTLSLGEKKFSEYDMWKNAGADRYLLKHETANPILYRKLHQGEELIQRLDHLRYLKAIGFQIGTGNIIGIPGQKTDDIVADILLCEELDADMVSISPFLPSAYTPFKNVQPANLELTLKTIASARIYLKNVHMPATTALGTMVPGGRELGIDAGANVIMPSFTPAAYKGEYLIYDNKICIAENPQECLTCLNIKMGEKGYPLSYERGDSPKFVDASQKV